jgi:hypothetical protein
VAQIFRPRANGIIRGLLFLAVLGLAAWAVGGYLLVRSDYVTDRAQAPEQPVPFSHEHHVNGLGIDCRYCHTSVETSAFAGIPPTHTCMTCHSQIWTEAPILAPVRQSLTENRPLAWIRVNDLGDFAYFNHAAHVTNGVGCVTCHGRVDRMPLTRRARDLRMLFCLGCHREPGKYIRPREAVFDMDWQPPRDRQAMAERLLALYDIPTGASRLTDCTICHR